VWRQALSTVVSDQGLEIELSLYQHGSSRIDFVARCAAGGHHDCCLRWLQLFHKEVLGVVPPAGHAQCGGRAARIPDLTEIYVPSLLRSGLQVMRVRVEITGWIITRAA
jgi:hypothetical protein